MDIDKIVRDSIKGGGCIYGYSNLGGLLPQKYSAYPYAAVIAMKLDDSVMDRVPDSGPTKEYLDLYNRVNSGLTDIVNGIAEQLRIRGTAAIAVKPTVADSELDDEYYKTLSMDFSHKMAATRAGLGWIGKTDLLVTEEFGPRVRLATVLTDQKPPFLKTPFNESMCGSCSACVKACPAQAASGKLWNINIHRDEFYNPFKCREMCRSLSKKNLDDNISICGICVAVCPKGKKSIDSFGHMPETV